MEKELKELENKTTEEGFWNNQKESSKILAEIKSRKSKCTKYKDLKDAAKNYVKVGKTYRPNMQRHQEYEKFYQRFRRLDSIVDDLLWDEIAK